jgi:MSHA pilin protein MshD
MRRHRELGVALIELVVSIVIVSIAAASVLGLLSRTTEHSADAMIISQAVSIAEAYLEEISLKPFADPDGVDGEGNRADFDDVDDYDGLVDAGAADQFGNPIAALSGYTVAVTVTGSAALPTVPAADAVRVDVRVSFPPSVNLTLSGYKTRL